MAAAAHHQQQQHQRAAAAAAAAWQEHMAQARSWQHHMPAAMQQQQPQRAPAAAHSALDAKRRYQAEGEHYIQQQLQQKQQREQQREQSAPQRSAGAPSGGRSEPGAASASAPAGAASARRRSTGTSLIPRPAGLVQAETNKGAARPQQFNKCPSGGGAAGPVIEEAWGGKPVYLRPQLSEVVAAVESLYADKLKPFGRILLKRVRECNAAAATAAARAAGHPDATVDTDSVPLIDPKCLRRICETCDRLQVEPEEGKEYSVLLIGRPRNFIDVCSPVDCYPTEMWDKASDYFEGLRGEDMMLPGGRYACAQVLMSRRLPFLSDCSLGEVCHIVQLAVSQKRILGYLEGNMVPFGRSVDWIKEQCAVWQQPVSFAKKAAPDMPLATWEEARACLWEILNSAAPPGQPGVITLSNVKRLFRSRFGLELSETALGHSRLNELLQDSRFGDICSMELQGKSQVVVQRVPSGAGIVGPEYWQATSWTSQYLTAAAAAAGAESSSSLDPNAAPWSPLRDQEALAAAAAAVAAAASSAGSSSTSSAGASREEPAAVNMLSSFVHQLLELDGSDGLTALQALTDYGSKAMGDPAADAVLDGGSVGRKDSAAIGDAIHRSGNSASRSTSDGSNAHNSDDDSDEGVASSDPRLSGFSRVIAPPTLGAKSMQPPPGLMGLTITRPPGL